MKDHIALTVNLGNLSLSAALGTTKAGQCRDISVRGAKLNLWTEQRLGA